MFPKKECQKWLFLLPEQMVTIHTNDWNMADPFLFLRRKITNVGLDYAKLTRLPWDEERH
jgi:hypothetical protein